MRVTLSKSTMTDEFYTAFEVTYFSNWSLAASLVFLAIVLFAGSRMKRGKFGRLQIQLTTGQAKFASIRTFVMTAFALVWVMANIVHGHTYTRVLKSGQCDVTEGVVTVIHQKSWPGHGDHHILVNDVEFVFRPSLGTLEYRGTISNGGALTDGVYARLHHYGGKILKVEIKQ